jgi:protein-tyrosine phosphatase
MLAHTWWIDKPSVLASSNPSDEDLARHRTSGFSVLVSLLDEKRQPPRYDQHLAALAGWAIYPFPIEEGGADSLDQIAEFTARLRHFPEGTKILVHCESGLGRSAFMGAVYWIAKGLKANEAIARVGEAGIEQDWLTEQRKNLLHEYEIRSNAG